jgi:hypothetical protein
MLNLEIKVSGKRVETLIDALQVAVAELEKQVGLTERFDTHCCPIYDKPGHRIDGHLEINLTGEPISYCIFGVKSNGDTIQLTTGFPAESYCYASATKAAINLQSDNPQGFVRVGLANNDGEILSSFENDNHLKVKEF